jgi:hypothetical protein
MSGNLNARSIWQILKERVARFNCALADAEADEMIFQPRPQDRAGRDNDDDFDSADGPAKDQPPPSARWEFFANQRDKPCDPHGASSSR